LRGNCAVFDTAAVAKIPMREPLPSAAYFVLVSRAQSRPMVDVWPIALGSKLPPIPVPLLAGDADVELDLQRVFDSVYDSFGYSTALDYSRKLQRALAGEERDWVRARLEQAGK
jgi:hypothetical protein